MKINLNGEMIEKEEALGLLKMLYHDAKEIAGEYHDMNRSEKFRINWPDQYKFADANWKTFVAAARAMYAERLGDPKTPPADARKLHLALLLQHKMGEGQEKDTRLQIMPGTQQFVGDPYENKKIVDTFGKRGNLRAALMNSVATRH
jgi:hypothetical protein